MSNILDIDDLCVRYPDGTEALRGVRLTVGRHERVGLIGPNGAGKTSLLLAVLRGVSYTGRIVVDSIELSRRTADAVRSRCGMVFQDAEDQLFMPTLLDDVAFGPLNQGLAPADAEARAREAIESVGLAALAARSAHHLSAGQKRNAALATALSMNVKLLLLDEPGTNLDYRSRRRLTELLGGRGEAMLLATGDLSMIGQLCRRVIVLDEGQVVAAGPTGEILADKELLSAHGLG